jgi:chromatin segregation and condensation protein Rec8/ScpA/Scc1 (kleisin family)
VREHMTAILRKLRAAPSSCSSELFDVDARAPGLVVSFLAVLELAREKLVEITQNEAFAPIYVKLPMHAATRLKTSSACSRRRCWPPPSRCRWPS